MDKDTELETILLVEEILARHYQCNYTESRFNGLTFLLADLMHYCDSKKLSYNAVVNAAKWHYQHNNLKEAPQV